MDVLAGEDLATVGDIRDALARRGIGMTAPLGFNNTYAFGMRPELAAAVGTERFLREIQISAGLDHPHILPLHDSGEADGLLYYVMPYIEGETLAEALRFHAAPRAVR